MKTISVPSRKILEKKVVSLISKKILSLLHSKPKVILGIPGGSSIKNILPLLSKQKLPWDKIHIFFVDERFVPFSSSKSNYKQASKYFKQNLHPFNYKKPISTYTKEFKKHGTKFDIILLGLGEDCHNASLFPEKSINNNAEYFIKVNDSPKPPKHRMSASRKLLEKSNTAILLAFGKKKQKALSLFQKKSTPVHSCPSKLIYKIKDTHVFTDLTS